jgi:hypothetical protein
MRLMLDGGPLPISPPKTSPPPPAPQDDKTFQAALGTAKTASAKVTSSSDTTHLAAAEAAWSEVEALIAQDYRAAALSSDPAAARARLDQQFGAYFKDQGVDSKLSGGLLKTANTEIDTETHDGTLNYQSDVFKGRQAVAAAQDKVNGDGANPSSADQAALTTAINNLINLELQHDVSSGGPAGPNGSHSLKQWTAAAASVEQDLGATDASPLGQLIQQTANVQGYLDNIIHNPASLNLTPAEQAMAAKDPVALAVLKANGVSLTADGQVTYTSNGPTSQPTALSPGMQQLAQQDPSLFAVLVLNHVNFMLVGTLPKGATDDSKVGVSQYLRITVNGHDITVSKGMAQEYAAAGANAPFVLANLLLSPDPRTGNKPLVQLSDSSQVAMTASDNVRALYGAGWMKDHMAGANPDGKAAIAFLGTQLNGFYSQAARQAFWQTSGEPYLKPFLQAGVNGVRYQDGWPYLTDMAQYMNGVLPDNAPPEVANLLINLVEKRVTQVFTTAFQNGQEPNGVNSIFYNALSKAVQIADQMPGAQQGAAADQVAAWLTNSDNDPNKGGSGISMINMDTSNKLNDAIGAGYTDLASALSTAIGKAPKGFYVDGFASSFKSEVDAAVQAAQTKQLDNLFHQQYVTFNLDPGKVLTPFFDGFANDPMIGHPQALSSLSNTALDDMIGKTLGLTPTDPAAAKALDYSKNWYAPNAADPSTAANWNTIQLNQQWIRSKSSANSTITALPFIYASDANGIINSALFEIDSQEKEYEREQGYARGAGYGGGSYKDVVKKTIIDGTAAIDAVQMSGGQPVDANNVDFQWHYSSLADFQQNNKYSDGDIYLPTNMQVTEQNGHVSYQKIAAHVTTLGQRIEQGAGYVVEGLAMAAFFVPGLDVGAMALLGAGWGIYSAGSTLHDMHAHGESIGWDNQEAQQQWMSIIGDGAGLMKFGIGALGDMDAWASEASGPWATRFAKAGAWTGNNLSRLAGATATYIGTEQTIGTASALVGSWGSMSTADKISAFGTLAGGMAQVALGTKIPHKAGGDPAPDTHLAMRAYKAWVDDNRPTGGATAAIWTDAETTLLNDSTAGAFQHWDAASRPKDPYFDQAYGEFKGAIEAHAKTLTGSPDPLAEAHDKFAPEIGKRAYDLWDQAGQPDSAVTASYWTQARQTFTAKIAYSYRVHRAAETLNGATGGQSVYKAWAAQRAAGKPWGKPASTDPNWQNAREEFQYEIAGRANEIWTAASTKPKGGPTTKDLDALEAEFAPQIRLRAAELSGTDEPYWLKALGDYEYQIAARANELAGSKKGGPQAKHFDAAEAEFGPEIGQRATTYWRGATTPPKDGVLPALWTKAEQAFETRVGADNYKIWQSAGKPTGSDAAYWDAAAQRIKGEIAGRAHELWDGASRPKGLTAKGWGQADAVYDEAVRPIEDTYYRAETGAHAKYSTAETEANTKYEAAINDANAKYLRDEREANRGYLTAKRQIDLARYTTAQHDAAVEQARTARRVALTEAGTLRDTAQAKAKNNRDTALEQAESTRYAEIVQAKAIRDSGIAPHAATRQNAIEDGFRVWDRKGRPKGLTAGYWRKAQDDFQKETVPPQPTVALRSSVETTDALRGRVLSNPPAKIGRLYSLYAGSAPTQTSKITVTDYLDKIYNAAQNRPAGSEFISQNGLDNGSGSVDATPLVKAILDGNPVSGYAKARASGDYFHFLRADADPDAVQERIYINAKADHVGDLMSFITGIVDDPATGVVEAKVAGPAAALKRPDNIVVYVDTPEHTKGVLQALDGYRQNHPGHFLSDVPPMTRKVFPGVSTAAEPTRSMMANADVLLERAGEAPERDYSFGSIRSDAMYLAYKDAVDLRNAAPKGGSFDMKATFAAKARERFLQFGIDPENPSRNAASPGDPLQQQSPTLNLGARLKARSTDFYRGMKIRSSDATQTSKTRARQYGRQALKIGKTFGIAGALVNGVGAIGWAGYYFAMQEHRTGPALNAGNAYNNLLALQANPSSYMATNYSTTVLGLDFGHLGVQNFTGDLMEVDHPDGPPTYFRRVPEDLFNALLNSHDSHVTVKDGQVYVNEQLQGKPIKVEIVPPYRDQPFRDAYTPATATGGPGGRLRLNFALGPIEGDRMHFNLELNGGYRYNSPTTTTIRLAAPSPNQGWELGVRQQDTSLFLDFTLSAGAIDWNNAQVKDLTAGSWTPNGAFVSGTPLDNEWMLANFRAYTYIGNRNREEFNVPGSSPFLRMRETGFLEMGLGADFAKFVYGKNSVNLNGYYELQAYAPDFRDQLNFGRGFITSSSQGMQSLPPSLLVDPALQLSWTQIPRLTDLPGVSGTVR